jgi:hypothetical protein
MCNKQYSLCVLRNYNKLFLYEHLRGKAKLGKSTLSIFKSAF